MVHASLSVPAPAAPSRRLRAAVVVPSAFVAGIAWGALARAWMRWISTDPEFSWSGTLFIVGAFAVFGVTQAIVVVTRSAGCRRPAGTVARVFGVLGMLPIFGGAGAVMLPTVVVGGLAVSRRKWRRWVRVVLAVVALVPVGGVFEIVLDDFGATLTSAGRCLLFVVVYAVVVWASTATFSPWPDGWRMPRAARWMLIAFAGLGGILAAIGSGVAPG